MGQSLWRLREFDLDARSFMLSRGGLPVPLDPKPLALLLLLAERDGAIVSHDEALNHVWGEGVYVDGEAALYTAVKKIRRALGDNLLVETVAGRGYRLKAGECVAIARPPTPAPGDRLAILPLVNLSLVAEQDYFTDGLTEELIATVARLLRGVVAVIARTSIMRFKGVSRPAGEIARELGVTHLVEGSVRRQGQRIRVAVQLLRAADAVCVWSETFESAAEDLFALQTGIALATAGAIRSSLTAPATPAPSRTVNLEVLDRYLRARHLWVQRTWPTITAAMRLFGQVLELDRTFAPAWAGLSCCHALLPITSGQPPLACFPEARRVAEEALRLDPAQAEAHIALGLVEFWFERNWPRALDRFREAGILNPADSAPLMFVAHVRSILGEHPQALAAIAEARAIDPLSPIVGTHVGHFLYNAGSFEQAVAALDSVIEMNPHFWIAHLMRGKALASLGRRAEAIAAFAESERLAHGNTEPLCFRIFTLAEHGQVDQARAAMTGLGNAPPMHRALAHLGLGELGEACTLLERSFAEHDVRLIFLAVERRWQQLGADRHAAFLLRAGLPRVA